MYDIWQLIKTDNLFLADYHLQIFKMRVCFSSDLKSQPNINQIKRLINQILSWLILNRKHFQFWKSKILFSRSI